MTSATCPLRWAVKLADAGLREKSGSEAALKVAITDSFAVTVTLQVPVPEQAPLQPENIDPEAAEAVKVTVVPVARLAEHKLPQTIPAGLPSIAPLPFPSSFTKRVKLVAMAPPSITVTLPLPLFAT